MDNKEVLICLITYSLVLIAEGNSEICKTKRWCTDCITTSSDCAWCNDKDFPETRCDSMTSLNAKKCNDVINPPNNQTLIRNDNLQNGGEHQNPIQLKPQKAKLQLRPGLEHTMQMEYRIAKNLPIDMYFVLDFTTTMQHRLKSLADLTSNLIENLKQQFTNNINIGFGSFLDKVLQPFTITTELAKANPCIFSKTTCEKTYGFIHRRKLNSDISSFINAIRYGNTSSNFDPMEGGLDAIMQACVCPDIIGWRSQSRRVLVYISDDGFHFAGDAKLGGVNRPNDGKCHMERYTSNTDASTEEYIYTHAEKLDYPSYGLLSKALDENKINTFFVVAEKQEHLYRGMSDMIKQAETAIMKDGEAQSIVDHIKEYYTELSETVEISGENIPPELTVKIATTCSDRRVKTTFDLKTEIARCKNLNSSKTVSFDVILTLKQCPADGKMNHTFKIVPGGLQEALEIEVDYTCDCNCKTSAALNEKCSGGNGTYECGVCRCNPGRSGEFCQCDKDSAGSIDDSNCKRTNTSTKICENQGTCKCGQCVCLANFDGRFCECDTSKCIMKGSTEKCSGIDYGDCICDSCKCNNGYYGDYCQCPPEINCMGENGLICSGSGTCECGKCVCQPNYEGDTCQDCPKCDRCRRCGYRSCVECLEKNQLSNVNTTNTECFRDCIGLNISWVDTFNVELEPCGFIDEQNCELNYVVKCEEIGELSIIHLLIASSKLCSVPADPLLIALPVLGGILGVGILLLIIWKILTTFYDKIEYARFEHEIQNAKWSQTDNPIYKTPVTSNQNPVYKGTVD